MESLRHGKLWCLKYCFQGLTATYLFLKERNLKSSFVRPLTIMVENQQAEVVNTLSICHFMAPEISYLWRFFSRNMWLCMHFESHVAAKTEGWIRNKKNSKWEKYSASPLPREVLLLSSAFTSVKEMRSLTSQVSFGPFQSGMENNTVSLQAAAPCFYISCDPYICKWILKDFIIYFKHLLSAFSPLQNSAYYINRTF